MVMVMVMVSKILIMQVHELPRQGSVDYVARAQHQLFAPSVIVMSAVMMMMVVMIMVVMVLMALMMVMMVMQCKEVW